MPRALHVAAGSAAATAITHPQLWALALWAYDRYPYWPSVLTLEALVVLVEGALIAWMAMLRPGRAMLVSLAANSGSLALGLFDWAVSGVPSFSHSWEKVSRRRRDG